MLNGQPCDREPLLDGQGDRGIVSLQVNLLKKAAEAGSAAEEIAVAVEPTGIDGTLVHVLDRGRGMDDEMMRQALVQLYSSKQSGSRLGLPLCSEILSAHESAFRLQRRPGGGMLVTPVTNRDEP